MLTLPTTNISPNDSLLLLIDFQDGLDEFVDGGFLSNIEMNVGGLCQAAAHCGVPIWLTTLRFERLSQDDCAFLVPVTHLIGARFVRDSVSAMQLSDIQDALRAAARWRIFVAGPMLETSLVATAVDAVGLGFDVGVVVDASGSSTPLAHEIALRRLEQFGVQTVLWEQLALAWCVDEAGVQRRDLARLLARNGSVLGRAAMNAPTDDD